MQDVDANAPGFYVTPKTMLEAADADADAEADAEDEAAFDVDAGGYEFDADDDDFDDDDIDETLTLPGYELAPLVDAEDAEAKLDAFNALFDEDDEGAKRRAKKKKKGPPVIVCARCFALRTSGRVKNEAGESLLPSFDFERYELP